MQMSGIPFEMERIQRPFQQQANFYIKLPFSHITEAKISIANRTLINRCSGRRRDLGIVNGLRIIDNKIVTRPEEMYVFHWEYERHFRELGIVNDADVLNEEYKHNKHNERTKFAIVNGNRDLGNNDWHIAWQSDPPKDKYIRGKNGKISEPVKQDRLIISNDEPYIQRTYNCLIVPQEGCLYIGDVRFNQNQDVIDAKSGENISDQINWLTYGKPMIRDGKVVDITIPSIIEQFGGDINHILKLGDEEVTIPADNVRNLAPFSDRKSDVEGVEILDFLYDGYPKGFAQKALDALKDVPRAEYYFNVIGTTEDSLIICQRQGTLEDVGQYLISEHGVAEAIILDEGGSVACWGSWYGPEGGFLNVSHYFRPSATSCIAFVYIQEIGC